MHQSKSLGCFYLQRLCLFPECCRPSVFRAGRPQKQGPERRQGGSRHYFPPKIPFPSAKTRPFSFYLVFVERNSGILYNKDYIIHVHPPKGDVFHVRAHLFSSKNSGEHGLSLQDKSCLDTHCGAAPLVTPPAAAALLLLLLPLYQDGAAAVTRLIKQEIEYYSTQEG